MGFKWFLKVIYFQVRLEILIFVKETLWQFRKMFTCLSSEKSHPGKCAVQDEILLTILFNEIL